MRRGLRGGCRRPVAGAGPPAGPRRARGAGPPRSVRGGRRIERRSRRLAAARRHRSSSRSLRPPPGGRAPGGRDAVPPTWSRRGARAARTSWSSVFAAAELPIVAWRIVPWSPAALGAAAAASRPTVVQAIVARPSRGADDPRPITDDAFERRLVVARRRLETAARAAGGPRPSCPCPPRRAGRSSTRASSPAAAWPSCTPTCSRRSRSATRSSTSATRRTRIRSGGSPSRSARSRTTARSTPSAATASRSAAARATSGPGPIAAELTAAGPLLSPDGSDSLSLDEGLELLTTTGWDLTPALLAAIPEALALRRAPHPHVATLRRRTAGMLAPWDGPAAIVFGDGRRVGALIDRNGLRPAAFAVNRDRLVAVASEAGAVPFPASETIRRGRLGPGELLLVEPGRRTILEDTDAKAWALRHLPIHDQPRPLHEDTPTPPRSPSSSARRSTTPPATSPGSTPNAPGSTSRPWPSRPTSRSGAWATTPRPPAAAASTGPSPITSARPSPRSRTRRSTRSASASSWTCGSSWVAARRCSAARRAVRGRFAWSGRSSPTCRVCSWRSRIAGRASARSTRLARSAGAARPGSARARDTRHARRWRAAESGVEVLVVSDAALIGRSACRSRPSWPRAPSTPPSPTPACAAGRTSSSMPPTSSTCTAWPWSSRSVPRPPTRDSRSSWRRSSPGRAARDGHLAPAAIGNLVVAFEAGLRKTLARMGISAVASYIGGTLIDTVDLAPDVVARCFPNAAAWPGRTTLRRPRRARPASSCRGRGPAADPRRPRAAPAGPGLGPLPRRRRGAPLLARDRQGDPGPVRVARGRGGRRVGRCRAHRATGRARAWRRRPPAVPRDELRVRRSSVAAGARATSRTRGRSPVGSSCRR